MSLRTRLLILVIAAMLVPAILVGLRFVQNRTSEIDAALVNLSATANAISNDLDENFRWPSIPCPWSRTRWKNAVPILTGNSR